MKIQSILIYIFITLLAGCTTPPQPIVEKNLSDQFKTYWYSGKAEITSYQLKQIRYGEEREGEAVLIFVSEDFSRSKQVKLDNPQQAGDDRVSVLKMNFTKNFITGIYPYSMMLSVFTPITTDEPTQKVAMSVQEWCGQVFTQINATPSGYHVQSNSYFETEGDEQFALTPMLLEDELWNLIRLQPNDLPVGRFQLIPGLFYTRLKHKELKPQFASGTKAEQDSTIHYTITFENSRTLTIQYQKEFPHAILGWSESYEENGKMLSTTASKKKSITIDYWTKNKNVHRYLRDSLGLHYTITQ